MANDVNEAIERIVEGIKSLAPLGANAVHRRALAIAEVELSRVRGQGIEVRCKPERPRPRHPRYRDDNTFGFEDAYYEHLQDDSRRSVLLDPVEALASQFIDFYTDRIDALEFRHKDHAFDDHIRAAQELALDHLSNEHALVNVLAIAVQDKKALINSLRGLAYRLEKNDIEFTKAFPEIGLLGREACRLIRTDAGQTRWTDNSRTLEQQFRDLYQCTDADQCCGNTTYTKYGPWRWQVVWRDDGNVMHPPPVPPDDFVPYAWDNRCTVLPRLVRANVTSDWGWRNLSGQTDFHGGIDIGVPPGTQVLNAVAGTVAWIKRVGANGATGVVVRTGNDLRTYWHIDPDASLQTDDQIAAGSVLGLVADRTGPHLHFALHTPPSPDVDLRSDAHSRDPCP